MELVVVNGPPDTLAQLYQVTDAHLIWSTPCTPCMYVALVLYFVQMFGRAGRDGCQARAHLLYTTRQTKHVSDPSLKSFTCEGNQENCRCKEMLVALGSKEFITSNEACCDICSGGNVPSPKLNVLVATSQASVRHKTDEIKEALRAALLVERERIAEEFPGFKMIGIGFILSDSTIAELCDKASTITSKEDLNSVVSLRPEYHDRLFYVIWQIVSNAPSPKKKKRRRK